MEDPPPFESKCGICNIRTGLLTCGGCNVMKYCTKDHQVSDRKSHKYDCNAIKDHQAEVESRKKELQEQLGDAWTVQAQNSNPGRQYGDDRSIHDFLDVKVRLADALLAINTYDAVKLSLTHLFDILPLVQNDEVVETSNNIVTLLLRINEDQKSYNVLKHWNTIRQHEHLGWKHVNLQDINAVNTDVFEDVDFLLDQKHADLGILVNATFLKLKLWLYLNTLLNAHIVDAEAPAKTPDQKRPFCARSTIISADTRLKTLSRKDHISLMRSLWDQIDDLYEEVWNVSDCFWMDLLDHRQHAPVLSNGGPKSELSRVLACVRDTWYETPRALEIIQKKLDASADEEDCDESDCGNDEE